MTISKSGRTNMFYFFNDIDRLTKLLSIIAVASAIISFLLNNLNLKKGEEDKKNGKDKTIGGFSINSIKLLCQYLTFFLTMAALYFQSHADGLKSRKEVAKDRKSDSTQIARLNRTLQAIDTTINAQQITLDSVDEVLLQQKLQLISQDTMLIRLRQTVAGNTIIIRGQKLSLQKLLNIAETTDAISKSTVDFFWGKDIDNSTLEYVKKDVELNEDSIEYTGDSYRITFSDNPDSKLVRQNGIQVDIFFIEKRDSIKISKHYKNDFENIPKNDIAALLNPQLEEFKTLRPKAHIQCFSPSIIWNKCHITYLIKYKLLDINYKYNANVRSDASYRPSFDDLEKMCAIAIVTSRQNDKNNSYNFVQINNESKRKTITLAFKTLIYQKHIHSHNMDGYQKVFVLAKPSADSL